MKERKIPLRKCVACQEMLGKRTLIRIVRTPEGQIMIDTTGKKPGRGAYFCGKFNCFKQIKKSRGLDRALNASVSPEVYEQLEKEFLKVADED
jgi:predicted RNA-binding protein YlxR (DUF448 family)